MFKNYSKILFLIYKTCKNWYVIIFSKIFKLKLDYIVMRSGLKISLKSKIPQASLSMLCEIFGYKFYNPIGFEVNDNDIVFDIGANAGFFSLYTAYQNKNSKVFAFEPVDRLYKMILDSKSNNNLDNLYVNNLAISNTNGEIEFNLSESHDGCHSLYNRESTDKKITVKTETLEYFCNSNNISKIDFLKLDCEGAEYEILLGLNLDFLKQKIKKISMEYHDDIVEEMTHEVLVKHLEKNNFEVKVTDGFLYAKNRN